jgi:CHAD domain-containing protein
MPHLAGRRKANSERARHLLRRQIRRALKKLDGSQASDLDIHDARRQIKKARATLRLMRACLSLKAYRLEEALLRKAARPLGTLRDGRVLIETLDELRPRYRGAAALLGTQVLRKTLVEALANERERVLLGPEGLKLSHHLLRKARRESSSWPVRRADDDKLLQGLRQRYGCGRRALKAAQRKPSVEAFHRLRKQTKYLSHQLQLFAPSRTSKLAALAAAFHQLSDELGDEHDLAVLAERVIQSPDAFPEPESRTRLLALIEQSRVALKKKSLLQAQARYAAKSDPFLKEVKKAKQDAATASRPPQRTQGPTAQRDAG